MSLKSRPAARETRLKTNSIYVQYSKKQKNNYHTHLVSSQTSPTTKRNIDE